MRLNPNATATVVIGGLALCHRNRKADIWEVVFLRASDNFHHLRMKISDKTEIPISQGDRIVINVTSPKSVTGTYKPTTEFFRRKATNVITDARWILDFSSKELYGRPLRVDKNPLDNFLTVPNALFYTWSLPGTHYSVQKEQDNIPVGKPVEFEEIGEFMAGDIECHAGGSVSVDIISVSGTKTFLLNKGDYVFFDNRCLEDVPECAQDFQHYFDILKTDGETFTLTPIPRRMSELQIPGLMGKDSACESTQIEEVTNPDDTIGD